MTTKTPQEYAAFLESLRVKNEGPEKRRSPKDFLRGGGSMNLDDQKYKCDECGSVFDGDASDQKDRNAATCPYCCELAWAVPDEEYEL